MNVAPPRIEPDRAASGARQLSVEFATDPSGRTYLHRQFAAYPFHVCRPLYLDAGSPGLSTLYIQSCSGGLYEHERLSASIVAAPRTEAHVTTQAPTVVHSMRNGSADQDVVLEAQDGAYLEYLPDPQILFPGSRCVSVIKARVAETATVLMWDSFLNHDPDGLGRFYAGYTSVVEVLDLGGKLLAVDRLKLAPALAPLYAIGTNGAFNVQGTIIVASRDARLEEIVGALRQLDMPYALATSGVSRLPNTAGLIVRVLACDGAMLARVMTEIWCMMRRALRGSLPGARRK